MVKKIIPQYLARFFLKAGVFVLLFSICRLLFLVFNLKSFPVVYFTDFLSGMWFDIMTTAIVFLPLGALETFPNKWRGKKWYQFILALSFHVTLFLCLLINLADIEYFKFTASRSTSSLFTMLGFGNDFAQQLPSFFKDYWYLFLFLFCLQTMGWWFYKRIGKIEDDSAITPWWKQIIIFPIIAIILVIVGRGGVGLRPVSPAKASAYTIEQNIALVQNSAFTVIKTWGAIALEEKDYFKPDELVQLFNPVKKFEHAELPAGTNVMIIILESFSVEYIASINGSNAAYTPFLDSLSQHGMLFTNCYANGKKSIDAMPSIISSLPKLMQPEYMTSQYASNRIESLPARLSELGYSSAFFHGATNGTMSFDVYCNLAEFDQYFGRNEYNNEDHFDGTWGIYDEEFLNWSAEKISQMSSPFFTALFTISSHPPYAIPEKHKSRFNQGPEDVHNSVRYSDYALGEFFKTIQKQPWYQNTLFVITADHTPASGTDLYYKDMGNMHIPLLLFHPSDTLLKGKNNRIVSQADIMPTVLDLLGYDKPVFVFGQSAFSDAPGYSASFVGDKFIFFYECGSEKYMLTWQDEKINGIYNLNDPLQTKNLAGDKALEQALLTPLKAMIQTYNHALISNKMKVD
ncbi:MAG: sulfatase-like hydrolase/transferase [Crocinitomicaceae bacterium]|nr:sulfatase-like hydrolase/transferase [Crocinitomicaceae bacterium]